MSWSVYYIGTSENLIKRLEEDSAKLDGQSKEEFDTALPHLVGLLKQNFNKNYPTQAISLSASGHGSKGSDGTYLYSTCNVKIEPTSHQVV